jgi:hypothetical protein
MTAATRRCAPAALASSPWWTSCALSLSGRTARSRGRTTGRRGLGRSEALTQCCGRRQKDASRMCAARKCHKPCRGPSRSVSTLPRTSDPRRQVHAEPQADSEPFIARWSASALPTTITTTVHPSRTCAAAPRGASSHPREPLLGLRALAALAALLSHGQASMNAAKRQRPGSAPPTPRLCAR